MDDYKALLNRILHEWQQGRVDDLDVQEYAESLYESVCGTHVEKDIDKHILEVLVNLDSLIAQRIISEDIPVILKFLNSQGSHQDWQIWHDYWDNVDYGQR